MYTQRATLFIWWIRSELWLANIIMHGVVHKYDLSLLVLPACIAIAYIGVADSTIYASIVHLYIQLSYINARTLLELARADLDSDLSGRAAAPTQAMHARRRTRWQTVKLQVARPGQARAADRDLHA